MAVASGVRALLGRSDGERRLGPFELVEQIGRGGFAPVWLAREVYGKTVLRTAAVKLFDVDGAEVSREAVLAEARALCRVEHSSVVRFYALPLEDSAGVMGLAMELVAGESLDRRIEHGDLLSAEELVAVGASVASALAAVHGAGLVHRDVKPANIIDASGAYKLIDFGIAAADGATRATSGVPRRLGDLPSGARVSEVDPDRTDAFQFRCGTLGYIDPECVALGRAAGASSDLYSLGATLFACATGKVPAAARSEGGRLSGDVLDGRVRPPPLLDLAPRLPAALGELVDALLAPAAKDRPRSASFVARRLEALRRRHHGSVADLPPEDEGPFRGLGAYDESHRSVYFGRTAELAACVEVLRGSGLVALIGPSGSGKSSLARAGLVPALEPGFLGTDTVEWRSVVFTPGHDPRASLTRALTRAIGVAPVAPEDATAQLAAFTEASRTGVLVVVDQLEELVTQAEPASAEWCAAALASLGTAGLPNVRIAVTVRRDLLGSLLGYPWLGESVLRSAVLVEPFSVPAWEDVIDHSLEAFGHRFEDEALRSRVLDELAPLAEAMPIVQFALAELWRRRDAATRTLTHAGFDAVGGISGALERHLEATYDEVTRGSRTRPEAVRRVLLALTTVAGTRDLRALGDLERDIGSDAGEVIAAFCAARALVKVGPDVTLAHDALIHLWPRLSGWMARDRADRTLVAEIEDAADLWGRDPGEAPLWGGRRLEAASELLARAPERCSQACGSFVEASRAAEARRRRARLAGAALLSVAVLGGVSVYLLAVRAEQERTRTALGQEQTSRALAEARLQDVRRAQLRIDELLRQVDDSPKKAELETLQRRVLEATGGAPPRSPQPSAPRPAVAPAPPASAAAVPSPGLKVQTKW